MSHVFLVGFMGAGKSTVGHLLAKDLGHPFIDLDETIEQDEGRSVTQIFAEDGETGFRSLETRALRALGDAPPSVVACGGGVILVDENRALLACEGRVVYLVVTPGEALARIGGTESRPLLAGAGGVVAATSLLTARESLYRASADIAVDTTGKEPSTVASEVLALLKGVEVE
ncbi:MAG: shikimate kinase [Actinomycetota bacterium]|nr:shikimate kinase [Actinomycetota bacterium]